VAKRKAAGSRTQAGVAGFTGLAFVALLVAGVTISGDSPGSSGSDEEVTGFYGSDRKRVLRWSACRRDRTTAAAAGGRPAPVGRAGISTAPASPHLLYAGGLSQRLDVV